MPAGTTPRWDGSRKLIRSENWSVLVADFSQWYVETSDLTELKVMKVYEGQAASIVPDALPELEITGIVDEILDGFYIQGGDISYKVRLRVADLDPQLRWGMTVKITFDPKDPYFCLCCGSKICVAFDNLFHLFKLSFHLPHQFELRPTTVQVVILAVRAEVNIPIQVIG